MLADDSDLSRHGDIRGEFPECCPESCDSAVKRMVDEANAMGADAIDNIRFGSSAVMHEAFCQVLFLIY